MNPKAIYVILQSLLRVNDEFKELKFVVNGKEVEPQGDLRYFAKPIKSDRKLPNWDLNKFANDLGEAINNSRELADSLEEEFNHDYYVNLSVDMDDEFSWQLVIELLDNKMKLVDVVLIDLEHFLDYVYLEVDPPSEFVDMDDEFSWQLVIELLDNKMKLVDVVLIDLEHFLDYVYLEVDPPSEFVDTAQMIAQFVFEHGLYPYPEDSDDLEENESINQTNNEDTHGDLVLELLQTVSEVLSTYEHYNGRKDDANE